MSDPEFQDTPISPALILLAAKILKALEKYHKIAISTQQSKAPLMWTLKPNPKLFIFSRLPRVVVVKRAKRPQS